MHHDTSFFASEVFWIGVALITFLAIITWKAGKTIVDTLDEKSKTIAAQIHEASELRKEAEALLKKQEARKREAKEDAREIIEQAKKQAHEARKKARDDLEAMLLRRERANREKIERTENQAMAMVKNQAIDKAIDAARIILADMEKTQSDKIMVVAIQNLAKIT